LPNFGRADAVHLGEQTLFTIGPISFSTQRLVGIAVIALLTFTNTRA
jgi:hypothetical protein